MPASVHAGRTKKAALAAAFVGKYYGSTPVLFVLTSKNIQILIRFRLIAFIAGADDVKRRGVTSLGSGNQVIDRIAILTAEIAGVRITLQNQPPKLLVRIDPLNCMRIDHDCGTLSDKNDGQLQLDLLIPAATVIRLAAHANKTSTRRPQTGRIRGLMLS